MDNLFNMAVILSAIDNASGPLTKVARSVGDLGQRAQQMAEMGQRMTVAGALTQGAAVQMTGALSRVVRPALAFESVMADVRKVVDFPTPAAFARMGEDILALSQRTPMAAEGIAQIVAAAGQSGIAREELLGFAEDAAKMGVAFDLSGAEAGQMMANWRAALGLTQEGVVALADAANHLSNNMNATARAIGMVIQRQGAVAKAAGLAETQTAALAAALLSSGAGPEIAATALKNLTGSLTMGSAATSRQREALQALGFTAEEIAALMQQNAQGAIMAVFEALAQEPAERRGALASMLFGEESKGAIMPLLTNLDNLRHAFGLVGDRFAFAGSMQAEYEARARTTENALQLLSNQLTALGVTLGELVLPIINDALPAVQSLVEGFTEFARANTLVFKVALGFAAVLAVALAIVAPILSVVGGLVMMGSYGLMGVGRLAAGFRWLRAGVLRTLPYLQALIRSVWHFGVKAVGWMIGGTARIATTLWTRLIPATVTAAARLGALTMAGLRFAARGAAGFAVAVARMAAVTLAGLVPALGAAIAGAWAFTAALLTNPITWIVAAIVGAAALIWAYWEPIKDFFTRLWAGVEAAFKDGFINGVVNVLAAFNPLAWIARGINAVVQYLFGVDLSAAAGSIIDSLLGGLAAVWNRLTGWFAGQWQAITSAFDEGLVQGLAAVFGRLNPVGWVAQGMDALAQYLFNIDLTAAGANVVNTIWEGVKSVASKPVQAIEDIVSKIREYLPFSPAKVGPLKDLDRIRLIETVAQSVRPEPLERAVRGAVAAGGVALSTAAGAMPALAAAPAAALAPRVAELPGPAATGVGGPVNVTFHITVEGDASPATVEALEERLARWVRDNAGRVTQAVDRERTRRRRAEFGEDL